MSRLVPSGFGVPASAGRACNDGAGLEDFDACCGSDALPAEAGTPNLAESSIPSHPRLRRGLGFKEMNQSRLAK